MSGTRPRPPENKAPSKPAPPPTRLKRMRTTETLTRESEPLISRNVSIDETSEESSEIVFARSGLSRKSLKRLKKGEYDYQAVLDMHGLRGHDVAPALERFLSEAKEYGYQCILTIYGKGFHSTDGKGVVRPTIIFWMKKHPEILAFCSAQPRHGGTGAAYILLRE